MCGGAQVETSGGFESVYLAAPPAGSRPDEDTPVARPVAIHQHLEVRRETTKRALAALPPPPVPPTDAPGDGDVALLPEDAPTGPRVIILGPEDSGKSTLCRTLLAYAARMGWQPTWVDVDLGQGGLTPPGCVAAAPVDRTCLSVEQGFERLAPLAYFTGAVSPSDGKLYSFAVSTLAGAVGEAQRVSAHARASGVIINTMGWVDGAGYALQLAVIAAFRPEVVLVMGQDKLYADLRRDLRGSTDDWASPAVSPSSPLVLKLPRSDGVVTRSSVIRRDARSQRVREYFYGKDGALGPHLTTVPFDDVRLLKLSGVTVCVDARVCARVLWLLVLYAPLQGDKMTMPVGYRETDAGIRVRAAEVAITADLVSCLLAVSFATTPAEVPTTNVAGFILVYVHTRAPRVSHLAVIDSVCAQ